MGRTSPIPPLSKSYVALGPTSQYRVARINPVAGPVSRAFVRDLTAALATIPIANTATVIKPIIHRFRTAVSCAWERNHATAKGRNGTEPFCYGLTALHPSGGTARGKALALEDGGLGARGRRT